MLVNVCDMISGCHSMFVAVYRSDTMLVNVWPCIVQIPCNDVACHDSVISPCTCRFTWPVTRCICMLTVVMAVEIAWLVVGVIWLVKYYHSCQAPTAKEALIGKPLSSPPLSSSRRYISAGG